MAVKWNDQRPVHLLFSVHQSIMVDTPKVHYRTRKPIRKPDMVGDYTANTSLLDKSYCQLSGVECLMTSVKWTHKFFHHLIDIPMLNACNVWLTKKGFAPNQKSKLREFTYILVYQLSEEIGPSVMSAKGRHHVIDPPDRLQPALFLHFPSHTEFEAG